MALKMYNAWLVLVALLLLAGDMQPTIRRVAAFVPSTTISPSMSKYGQLSILGAQESNEEEIGMDEVSSSKNAPDVGRRGTLMTLLGTAASFAMGDVVLNAAVKATGAASTAVMSAGGGLYERVLAFGNARGGAAIASEELTTWIASQGVAATPEITAWLAAQRKLQLVRKSTMAATAALSRAKTTKRAAAAGGSMLEEGLLVAAATAAAKMFSAESENDATLDSKGTATKNEPAKESTTDTTLARTDSKVSMDDDEDKAERR